MKTVCKLRLGAEKRFEGLWASLIFYLIAANVIALFSVEAAIVFGFLGVIAGLIITAVKPNFWHDSRVKTVMFIAAVIVALFALYDMVKDAGFLIMVVVLVFAIILAVALFIIFPVVWKKAWVSAGCPEDTIK